MTTKETKNKLKVFNGGRHENYTLWRKRAELALQDDGHWDKLQDEKCDVETKRKASQILVSGLGDDAFQVCSDLVPDALKMLEALDERFASKRATSQIALIDSILRKKFRSGDDMEKYVNEFESLFSQLSQVQSETTIPDILKGPMLLSSIQYGTGLESMAAALRTKDIKELTWKSVSADLIEERKRVNQGEGLIERNSHKKPHLAKTAKGSDVTCGFCGKKNHTADTCFMNPESEQCRLTEQEKENIAKANSAKSVANIRVGY